MRYGVILPNVGPMARIETLARIAREAEALGYHGVFLSDHVALPARLRSAYPYRSDGHFPLDSKDAILEPIAALSYLAAVTDSARLGFSVLVLPYRHPVLNAKMLATLDVISSGRLIVGAGVGWMAEEFDALGAEFESRGAATDSHIRIMRALWTGANLTDTGVDPGIREIEISPRPSQSPCPPIWTGGISAPALRRAASLGDGWHGVRQSPGDVADVVARISRLRSELVFTMAGYEISLRAGLEITGQSLSGEGRTPLRGSANQIAQDLVDYADAGLTYLVAEPRAANPDQFIEQLQRFSELPKP